MAVPRVIPVLLLRKRGLVKTVRFKEHKYVGDPINAIKIFNEKEVDELCFLDIDASKELREPPYEYLKEISSECFMPLSYGGAIKSLEQIQKLIQSGIEKVVVNTQAIESPQFLKEACSAFGSSTIVGAVDVKKNFWGNYQVYSHVRGVALDIPLIEHIKNLQAFGVGEIFVNNVDQDGMMNGYDLKLVKSITSILDVPVIACGGCGSLEDIAKVVHEGGASAAAAGSFFVFHGKHRAVLITYPGYESLEKIFGTHKTQ